MNLIFKKVMYTHKIHNSLKKNHSLNFRAVKYFQEQLWNLKYHIDNNQETQSIPVTKKG